MRNKGIKHDRLKHNELERRFAEAWDADNSEHYRTHLLEYILSDEPNKRKPFDDRDREVAATIIQWLGTIVGSYFIDDVCKGIHWSAKIAKEGLESGSNSR